MSGAEGDYPEQRHAGAVGYGPEYHKGATLGDKMSGLTEEVKGKVTRKPDVVEHGREMRTGQLKQKSLEDDEDPFKKPGAEPSAGAGSTPADDHAREQASTIAPEGTHTAERQRTGNDESMKMMNQ
ncbi:hypothetical protein GLOTRDRAFT_112017 [Gloeophyllum trabeum ATCC 11539]|uniref:Uncharacterized protein n=1 Tax=Gloeophyllum trabeum (strain ATCC 11539 / FP-39264 / Madison 617) TaxID=670483 RepID=S7RIZ8_GLOTA|nr:uncharacterized protein GLOTRDRAFT_112017 [Gloeophyllum trabeum ATCC 11539]EPQ52589.1 hypothetical protein GLOTRDRAFT_112017 [Gloeophyllum trabeum ATCC 11539]